MRILIRRSVYTSVSDLDSNGPRFFSTIRTRTSPFLYNLRVESEHGTQLLFGSGSGKLFRIVKDPDLQHRKYRSNLLILALKAF